MPGTTASELGIRQSRGDGSTVFDAHTVVVTLHQQYGHPQLGECGQLQGGLFVPRSQPLVEHDRTVFVAVRRLTLVLRTEHVRERRGVRPVDNRPGRRGVPWHSSHTGVVGDAAQVGNVLEEFLITMDDRPVFHERSFC